MNGSRLGRWIAGWHGSGGWPFHPELPVPWRRVLPVALLGMLAAGLLLANRVGLPDELDPLAPFVIGTDWGMDRALAAAGVSIDTGSSLYGYDGQWFLGQAYDPLLRTEVASTFDAPRYRSLRALFPTIGWLLAVGQPAAIPFALLGVEIAAVGLGCAACARIVAGYRRSKWWGLMFAAIPGVVVGVAYGTAEPVGLALAALGVCLVLDRRYAWAGLAFAGATLTKENYLLFAAVVGFYLVVDGQLRGQRWLRPVLAVITPAAAALVAWWWYVASVLPPDSTTGRVLRVFDAPFVGWGEALLSIVRGTYVSGSFGWTGPPLMVATCALLLVGLVLALRRGSVLSYLTLVWGGYGVTLSGLLLGRFLSAQRALAPAVLVAGLLLLAAGWAARAGGASGPDRPGAGSRSTGRQPISDG